MKKILESLFFLLAVGVIFAQGAPKAFIFSEFAEKLGLPNEYSAEVETIVGGEEGMVMKMKIYASKAGMRSETELPGGLGTMTTLAQNLEDGVKVYMLNPMQKTYSLLPSGKKVAASSEQYQIKDLGQEIVEGQSCLKKAIVGPEGNETVIWQSNKDQSLVRCELTEQGNKVIMRFRNFQPGVVDSKLLQIPADYKQSNIMQGFLNLAQ